MDTSLSKDKDVSITFVKTPEQNSKKVKQLTLFEMSSKSKFSLGNASNTPPAKPLTPNDENKKKKNPTPKNGKLNKKVDDKENLNKSNAEIIEIKDEKELPNKENSKKSIDFFSKSQANQKKITNKKKETDMEKEDSTEESGASVIDLIMNQNSCVVKVNKPDLEKCLEEFGKLALSEEKYSNENETFSKLENYMFGDIALIIELYNILVKMYGKKLSKSKKSAFRKYQNEKNKNLLNLVPLEYESFLKMIITKTESGKSFFIQIISNLLNILLFEEKIYENTVLFNFKITDLKLNQCLIQEICKIIVSKSFSENKDLNNEKNILIPDDEIVKNCKILSDLQLNLAQEPFFNFEVNSKLDLIRFLCDQILAGEKFEEHLINLRNKIAKLEEEKKLTENELKTEIATQKTLKLQAPPEKVKIQNEKKVNKLTENLQKITSKLQNQITNLKRFERIEPLGIDSKGHVYWYFSFLKRLIVEKITNKEIFDRRDKSEWFIFSLSQAKSIIGQLKLTDVSNRNLIKKIEENLEKIYDSNEEKIEKESESENESADDNEEKNSKEKDKVKKENDIKDEDIQASNNLRSHFEIYEKRVTRGFQRKQVLESLNKSESSSESEDENSTVVNKKEIEETDNEWSFYLDQIYESHNGNYWIDDLFKFLINVQCFKAYIGQIDMEKFENVKKLGLNYLKQTEFSEKFFIYKEILLTSFSNINHNLNLLNTYPEKRKTLVNCIENSESLSNMFLLTYAYFKIINWKYLKEKACTICKKIGSRFKRINDLNKFEEYKNEGFFSCKKCHNFNHKKCVFEGDGIPELSLQNICKECNLNKNKYTYESFPAKETSNGDIDDLDIFSERKLRKKVNEINYSESNLREKIRNKISSEDSSSSRSDQSRSSIESIQTRKKTRSAKSFKESSIPTRSSSRLKSEISTKSYIISSDESE